jgi:hypothetical protein
MKKSIGLDLENQAARPITPAGLMDRTAVVIVRRRGSEHRKCAKAMFAFQERRCVIEFCSIQLLPDRQLARTAKW